MPTHFIFLSEFTEELASRLQKKVFEVFKQKKERYKIDKLGLYRNVWMLNASSNMTEIVQAMLSGFNKRRCEHLFCDRTEYYKDEEAAETSHNGNQTFAVSASPLLSLPAELRNHIYRYTLVEPEGIEMTSSDYSHDSTGPSWQEWKEPALLRTCRQVRQEALDMYYFENNFLFEIKDISASDFIIFWLCRSQHRCPSTIKLVPGDSENRPNESIEDFSYMEGHAARCVLSDQGPDSVGENVAFCLLHELLNEVQCRYETEGLEPLSQTQVASVLEDVHKALKVTHRHRM